MTQLNKIIKIALVEQRGTVMKAGPADPNTITGPFNAARIAKQIYDAKGLVSDSEEKVAPAIAAIKNITQYTQVTKALQKLTGGRGIGEYLRSFMDINPRMNIASQLMNIVPEAHWNWTIKQIVPWSDFRTVAQNKPSIYDKWRAGQTGIGEEKSILKLMAGPYAKAWTWYSNLSASEQLDVFWKENGHTILTTLQIITAFVPVVGWAVSAGIGLVNANEYRKEGDPKTAGIEAIFAVIPGLAIGAKLGLNKVAPKILKDLGKKVAGKQTKNLTKQEQWILSQLSKQQGVLKKELDNYFKTGIAKSVKQLSRDKLAAASRQLGIGATKTSATLGSYEAIASLYDTAYDSNITLITPTEIAALDKKYTDEAAAYLNKRLTQELSKIKENTQKSNLRPLTEGLGDILTIGSLLAVVGSGIVFAAKFGAVLKTATIAFPRLKKLTSFRKIARDVKFLREQGMTNAEINALWKSSIFTKADRSTIDAFLEELKNGTMDPKTAMTAFTNLIPGQGKQQYQSLEKLYNIRNKTAPAAKTSGTSAAAIPGWSADKFPNINADQYAKLGINQRQVLQKNPTFSMSKLAEY